MKHGPACVSPVASRKDGHRRSLRSTRPAPLKRTRSRESAIPYIHIRSLPFQGDVSIDAVLKGVSQEFSRECEIDLEHVTVTWDFLRPGHHASGGTTADTQSWSSHPILVDLLAPDFNSFEQVETMMGCVASSIQRHTGIPRENIFIHHREARSSMVFDKGEIVRW